jgi:hypothetical protein
MNWGEYLKTLVWATDDSKGGHACPHCHDWIDDDYSFSSIVVWCSRCQRHFKRRRIGLDLSNLQKNDEGWDVQRPPSIFPTGEV